jgi:hypothetical protein
MLIALASAVCALGTAAGSHAVIFIHIPRAHPDEADKYLSLHTRAQDILILAMTDARASSRRLYSLTRLPHANKIMIHVRAG